MLNIITSIDSEESSYSDVTDDGNSEKKDKDKDDTDNDDDEEGAGAGLGGAANSTLIAAWLCFFSDICFFSDLKDLLLILFLVIH